MGAWIEIGRWYYTEATKKVAPLVGAWIEIKKMISQEKICPVAPLVGAWIEIEKILYLFLCLHVAPLVGAWIEIYSASLLPLQSMSLPSWERGLKSPHFHFFPVIRGRSPRGSVD